MYPGFGFSYMDRIFPVVFSIVFLIVIGGFLYVIIKSLSQFISNQKSPMMVVDAKIVSKRTEIRSSGGSMSTQGSMHHHRRGHTYTRYFATFQLEDSSRIELQISAKDFGLIAEGDIGRLFHQGTRFHGFDRH